MSGIAVYRYNRFMTEPGYTRGTHPRAGKDETIITLFGLCIYYYYKL